MFWGSVFCVVLSLGILVSSQGVATICPDEPVPAPGYCPAICNGGCDRGVCEIRNPNENFACPDEMPCRVVCEGLNYYGGGFSCSEINVQCSKYASCDIFMLGGGGMGNFGVDCANTTHSCSVFCDAKSIIFDRRCSNTTSCNCASNCVQVNSYCTPGVDCLGDVCYQRVPDSCVYSVRGLKEMHSTVFPNGTCDCECNDPTLTKISTPQGWICGDPALVCTSNTQCNYPINGKCDGYGLSYCTCFNPWTGPDCLTHGCPHCQNGAFCGYTNSSECICTGHWTGEFCTERLPIVPSRPDIPENVERCTGSELVVWPTSPPASGPVTCPEPCSICSTDDDGTPVCKIILPLPGFTAVTYVCPDTHRCLIICNGACPGYVTCNGPFPCDLFCLRESCSIGIICKTPSICRTTCPDVVEESSLAPMMDCMYPNGSCLCDTSHCPRVTCDVGASCNGDPCATQPCPAGKQTVYNATDNTCHCKCRPWSYENNGECYPIEFTRDCSPNCTNGGICRAGQCWCKPGYSGVDCSVRDSCVAVSSATTCPPACSFCEDGVCVLLSNLRAFGPCPIGWPCVFICNARTCDPPNDLLRCPQGSGPCEVWCWDELPPQFISYFRSSELRPRGACTNVTLLCEDHSIGCRARCDQQFVSRSTSPYYQSRTIRSVQCGSNAPNATSASPLDRCSSCGSDTCYIGSGDPCYTTSHMGGAFGYLPICPADKAGQWLIPAPDFAAGTCGCGCAPGFQLVDGACSATGCDPICQNSGICIASGAVGTPQRSYSCRCFGGWTGRGCTSRCFFPISANVTACYGGVYQISGELSVPTNQSVDLFKEVIDMTQLIVGGNVVITNSSTLIVGVTSNWTSGANATISVAGNWTQQQNTTLRTAIIVNTTSNTLLTTSLTSNGTVSFKGGILTVDVNPDDIKNWLQSTGASNLTIEVFSYQRLLTEFDDVNIASQLNPSSSCERIVAQPVYSSGNDGRGSLNVLFRLDTSACSGISAGGIAAIVIVFGAVFAVALVFVFLPPARALIAPFFDRSGPQQHLTETELHDMDQESPREPKSQWQPGHKGTVH